MYVHVLASTQIGYSIVCPPCFLCAANICTGSKIATRTDHAPVFLYMYTYTYTGTSSTYQVQYQVHRAPMWNEIEYHIPHEHNFMVVAGV